MTREQELCKITCDKADKLSTSIFNWVSLCDNKSNPAIRVTIERKISLEILKLIKETLEEFE